jgi:hypothetical protein
MDLARAIGFHRSCGQSEWWVVLVVGSDARRLSWLVAGSSPPPSWCRRHPRRLPTMEMRSYSRRWPDLVATLVEARRAMAYALGR